MKCTACGYEEAEQNDVHRRFIDSELKISYEAEGNYYNQVKSKTILICPDCGTLKIDV